MIWHISIKMPICYTNLLLDQKQITIFGNHNSLLLYSSQVCLVHVNVLLLTLKDPSSIPSKSPCIVFTGWKWGMKGVSNWLSAMDCILVVEVGKNTTY